MGRGGFELVGPERDDVHDVVGEQPAELRIGQRPVVEVGAHRHEHVDAAVRRRRPPDEGGEERVGLLGLREGEQLLELVDHEQEAVPVGRAGGRRVEEAGSAARSWRGGHATDVAARLARAASSSAKGCEPGCIERDPRVRRLAPNLREQPRLHGARLAGSARSDHRGEGAPCSTPVAASWRDQPLLAEEACGIRLRGTRAGPCTGSRHAPASPPPAWRRAAAGSRSGSWRRICSSRRRSRGDGSMPSSSASATAGAWKLGARRPDAPTGRAQASAAPAAPRGTGARG